MKRIKKGDKVSRISYGNDIIFEVTRIIDLKDKKNIAILKGITKRIEVDSDVDDLVIAKREDIEKDIKRINTKFEKKLMENKTEKRIMQNFITGKILHLDGDRKYSEKSQRYYQKAGLSAIVKNVPEYKQPNMVYQLLSIYKPDILVITRA